MSDNAGFPLPEVHLQLVEEAERLGIELESFLRQKTPSIKDRFNIIRQISHCLLWLHNEKIVCTNLTPSRISIIEKFFPKSVNNSNSEETENQADMRLVADLYCLILTGDRVQYTDTLSKKDIVCEEPELALDLMKQMAEGEITIKEVLQHPFHWSCFQKVHFLCRAVDYIKGDKTNNNNSDNQRQALDDGRGIIPSCGWVENLRMTDNEIKQWIKSEKGANYTTGTVPGREVIYKKALEIKRIDEKKMSIYELLNFFRNRYCHFSEDGNDIKACFGSYPEGYWKFFSSHFPKLFMHVYNQMKSYVHTKYCVGEFDAKESSNAPVYNVHLHHRLISQ